MRQLNLFPVPLDLDTAQYYLSRLSWDRYPSNIQANLPEILGCDDDKEQCRVALQEYINCWAPTRNPHLESAKLQQERTYSRYYD